MRVSPRQWGKRGSLTAEKKLRGEETSSRINQGKKSRTRCHIQPRERENAEERTGDRSCIEEGGGEESNLVGGRNNVIWGGKGPGDERGGEGHSMRSKQYHERKSASISGKFSEKTHPLVLPAS